MNVVNLYLATPKAPSGTFPESPFFVPHPPFALASSRPTFTWRFSRSSSGRVWPGDVRAILGNQIFLNQSRCGSNVRSGTVVFWATITSVLRFFLLIRYMNSRHRPHGGRIYVPPFLPLPFETATIFLIFDSP